MPAAASRDGWLIPVRFLGSDARRDGVITVLVAARRAAARARLDALVGGSWALRLLAWSPTASLDEQIRALRPDVVLLDLDGERIGSALAGLDPAGAGLIVLAEDPARALVDETVADGVIRGVLPREATSGEILAAIEAVAAGLVALHPEALDRRTRRPPARTRAVSDPAQPLTAREMEVLGMLADGLGNKILAARLGISAHTAKFHVASIMAKLGAGSRTEAVTIGMRRGLVVI
jgi:two-component system, NarL family, response regulator YdfI